MGAAGTRALRRGARRPAGVLRIAHPGRAARVAGAAAKKGTDRAARVCVRDHVDTPQRFGLQQLLRRTCAAFGVPGTSTCLIHTFWGYGERIGEMETSFDVSVPIVLTVAELDALVKGVDEWFYAIDVSLLDGDVRLGLQDSTVMFVEGAEPGVREMARHFAYLIWDSLREPAR